MRWHTTTILTLGAALLTAPASANSIDIQVLNVTYKAAIDFSSVAYNLASAPSSTPVREQSILDAVSGGHGRAYAAATADWLTVATSSSSDAPSLSHSALGAASQAEFELTFSPLADGVGSIGLAFPVCGTVYAMSCGPNGIGPGPYTQGFADLFDLTLGQDVWRYTSTRNGGVSIVIPGSPPNFVPPPSLLPTMFSVGHVYDLHLLMEGDSFGDSTTNGIQVTGLVSVPDATSTAGLLAIGLATASAFRRRVRR